MLARLSVAVAAMAAVVAASNYLVQFPVQGQIGGVDLSNLLTYGAFTYPVAFLVNDLTNRRFGPRLARLVVLVGFVIAVVWSAFLSTPRIAIASGSAFLVAQLLDITIFDRLRRSPKWWRAPFISSMTGSVLDTLIFFSVAFAAPFAMLDGAFGRSDGSLMMLAPYLGIGHPLPLWLSLASGDFIVKTLVALTLLAPYRVLRTMISDGMTLKPVAAG